MMLEISFKPSAQHKSTQSMSLWSFLHKNTQGSTLFFEAADQVPPTGDFVSADLFKESTQRRSNILLTTSSQLLGLIHQNEHKTNYQVRQKAILGSIGSNILPHAKHKVAAQVIDKSFRIYSNMLWVPSCETNTHHKHNLNYLD